MIVFVSAALRDADPAVVSRNIALVERYASGLARQDMVVPLQVHSLARVLDHTDVSDDWAITTIAAEYIAISHHVHFIIPSNGTMTTTMTYERTAAIEGRKHTTYFKDTGDGTLTVIPTSRWMEPRRDHE